MTSFTDGSIRLLSSYGILCLEAAEFLFDVEDLPLIESRSWYKDKDGYLVSCYYFNGCRRFVRFHRIVMQAKPGQFVDHINKNRADNRKHNLRCLSAVHADPADSRQAHKTVRAWRQSLRDQHMMVERPQI